MNYRRVITLEHEVLGSDIVKALQGLANKLRLQYAEEHRYGRLAVGLSSIHPNEHVGIMTGEGRDLFEIKWSKPYTEIAVAYHHWSGLQHPEALKEVKIKKTIDKVANELEKTLNSGK
ncbi:hypothetical protein HY638_03785 [Candidatus Woesearchaeota archaeon]|nr:hypothetical protein [Candidatus Woesearchaeota archaeon]